MVPHDLFIRFLLTQGLSDIDEMNDKLEALGLTSTDQKAIDRHVSLIETSLPLGTQAQIDSKLYSADFIRWMKVLDVAEMWCREKFAYNKTTASVIKLVYDILQDPTLKLCLNALLMKGINHRDLSQIISVKFSTMLKEEHIDIYEKFFFNPRLMTRGNWKAWLKTIESNKEVNVYFMALTEDIETVKTELDLPAKTSSSEVLQFLLNKSYQKARHFLAQNTPYANKESRDWIEQVTGLIDKYEKYRSSDKDDFAKTLQLEFDYVDTEFPVPEPDILKEMSDRIKKSQDGEAEKMNEVKKA